jgi:hypothetical protein
MELHDDLKILPARRGPRETHHSHKLLNIAAEMGLKLGNFIGKDDTATTRGPLHQTFNLKPEKQSPPTNDPPSSMARRPHNWANLGHQRKAARELQAPRRRGGVFDRRQYVSKRYRRLFYMAYLPIHRQFVSKGYQGSIGIWYGHKLQVSVLHDIAPSIHANRPQSQF